MNEELEKMKKRLLGNSQASSKKNGSLQTVDGIRNRLIPNHKKEKETKNYSDGLTRDQYVTKIKEEENAKETERKIIEETERKKQEEWNNSSLFDKIVNTTGRGLTSIGQGFLNSAEAISDFSLNRFADVSDILGNKDLANEFRTEAQREFYNETLINNAVNEYENKSFIKSGDLSDSVLNGVGQVAANVGVSKLFNGASLGVGKMQMPVSSLLMGMGRNETQAMKDGASIANAKMYGLGSGLLEGGTEGMFGGIGGVFGEGALDDIIVEGATKGIKNNFAKNLATIGLKAGGEGIEEVVSGYFDPYLQRATINPNAENYNLQQAAEDFRGGFLTSALIQTPGQLTTKNSLPLSTIPKSDINNQGYVNSSLNTSKHANLTDSVNAYFDTNLDTTKAMYQTLDKIQSDRNLNIVFDETIKGNGLYTKAEDGSRTIRLNPKSERSVEFTVMHEITHDLEGTDEFNELKDTILNYDKGKFGFEEARENLLNIYKENGINLSDIELDSEATSDVVGQMLGDQDFINNLSVKKPNVFQKVKRVIEDFLERLGSDNKEQTKFLQDVKKRFENAYRQNNVSEQGSRYSAEISRATLKKELDSSLKGEIPERNTITIANIAPDILIENGIMAEPISMAQAKLKKVIEKHNLNTDIISQIPEALNNPKRIFKSDTKDGSYVIETELKNKNNKPLLAIIKINGLGQINDFVFNSNILTSTYGKDKYERFIKNQTDKGNLLYENKKSSTSDGLQLPTLVESSETNISQDNSEVNKNSFDEKSYQTGHQPVKDGSPSYDISNKERGMIPNDVFEHPEWYFDMKQDYNKESFSVIKKIKGKPDADVTIYRATTGDKINSGDWVTFSKKYAEDHNSRSLDNKGKIVELKVKAKDVLFAGDDINEFGYFPIEDSKTKKETTKYNVDYKNLLTQKEIKDITSRYSSERIVDSIDTLLNKKGMSFEERIDNNQKIETLENGYDNVREYFLFKKAYNKSKNSLNNNGKWQNRIDTIYNLNPSKKVTNLNDIQKKNKNELPKLPIIGDDKFNNKNEEKVSRKEAINKLRNQAKIDIENINNWNDISKIKTQTLTPKRVLRAVAGNDGEKLYNKYVKPISDAQKVVNQEIEQYNNEIKKLNLSNTESEAVQMLGEYKYNKDTLVTSEQVRSFVEKNQLDYAKLENSVEVFRNTYDELFERVNDVLESYGYKKIGFIKGYFPHFVDEKSNTMLGKIAQKLGYRYDKQTLPTDIAGITDQFKPGKKWVTFAQERKGKYTEFNALKGFDNYVRGAMELIHHTPNIQRLRALDNEIRYQYSDKGYQKEVDEIWSNSKLDYEEKIERISRIDSMSPLPNFASFLTNYTNIIAGKKSNIDRGMESLTERNTMYGVLEAVNKRTSANMVGANISSALTNFIPLTQMTGEVSVKNIAKASMDVIKNSSSSDDLIQKSTFLTNRLNQADRLFKTNMDKINDGVSKPFEIVDGFTSEVVVRGKYYENLDKGMTDAEALKNADEFAKDLMAGRSKGEQPTIFSAKNPLVKMFTAFQLEVNNQYQYMFNDLPENLKEEGISKLIGAFLKMFLGAYLYNEVSEKVVGRRSAFDPIEFIKSTINDATNKEMTIGDRSSNLAENAAKELPFVGGILGGGRLPISAAIPDLGTLTKSLTTISDDEKTDESKETARNNALQELSKPLYYLLPPFGGGQIKKTIEGAKTISNKGSYTNSGKLRFPVEPTALNTLQSILFGQYSNENAKKYFERGETPLSKKQTKEFKLLDIPIEDYWDYKKEVNKKDKVEDKIKYISDLNINTDKKNIMASNVSTRKSSIDMEEYSKVNSLAEYDFKMNNPIKHKLINSFGIKYSEYVKYQKEITSIKERSYKKKEDTFKYINSLELNKNQKNILMNLVGGYSIKEQSDNFYNEIEKKNLSKNEKKAMYKLLFN